MIELCRYWLSVLNEGLAFIGSVSDEGGVMNMLLMCTVCIWQVRHNIDLWTEEIDDDILGLVAKKVLPLVRGPVTSASDRSVSRESRDINKAVKSIHHFCILPDGLQPTTGYRGIWRRHQSKPLLEVSVLVQKLVYGDKHVAIHQGPCHTRFPVILTVLFCSKMFLMISNWKMFVHYCTVI